MQTVFTAMLVLIAVLSTVAVLMLAWDMVLTARDAHARRRYRQARDARRARKEVL